MNTSIKIRILNVILIIFSLFGYLEWGGNNKQYLFDIEYEVVSKLLTNPMEALHPLVILPLLGQMMLAYTLYQSEPSKQLTYIGIALISILMIFILIAGLTSMNYKIILSVLPFTLTSVYTILQLRKQESN